MNGLLGRYFTGLAIYASASTIRVDPTVDFTWGAVPLTGVSADNFFVRWMGEVQPAYSQTYTFYATVDDGARLWVDGRLIIDGWTDGSVRELSGTIALTAGVRYDLRLEYYSKTGSAAIRLSWSSASQVKEVIPTTRLFQPLQPVTGGTGLWGDYFDTYFGAPWDYVGHRNDGPIDFTWTSVGTGLPNFTFSTDYAVLWTGYLIAPTSGIYTFYTSSDDGVVLTLGGLVLIDNYTTHSETEDSGAVTLTAGSRYLVRLDYFQGGGSARIKLSWTPPGGAKATIPAAVLFR